MTRAKEERYFAAIPLRAWLDRRLTRRHIFVLGIISAHDQFNRNGQGCTASQRRLAELAACHETHVSEMVRDLRDWEYIATELRGRTRVHRIIWKNEIDRLFWNRIRKNTTDDPGNDGPRGRDNTYRGREASGSDTYRGREGDLPCEGSILTLFDQKKGLSDSDDNSLSRRTYVLTESKQIREGVNGDQDQTDCAKARFRRRGFSDSEANALLEQWEAIKAEGDPNQFLKFERKAIEQVADDIGLPEKLCDRARSLLAANRLWLPAPAFTTDSPPEQIDG